jgi:hypothetical protein
MWTAAAATLHGTEIVESGDLGGFEVVPQMATIFTSVYGEWSAAIFLLSVMAALFSTLIGPLYGMSRLWEDAFAVHGLFDKYDITRDTVFRLVVVLFAAIPLALNLVIEAPLFLFALSGIIFAPAVGLMYLGCTCHTRTSISPVWRRSDRGRSRSRCSPPPRSSAPRPTRSTRRSWTLSDKIRRPSTVTFDLFFRFPTAR